MELLNRRLASTSPCHPSDGRPVETEQNKDYARRSFKRAKMAYDEWLFHGDLIHDAAENSLIEGRAEDAQALFLAASRYLRSCDQYLFGPDHNRALGALKRGRACFVKALEMSAMTFEIFDINWQETTLTGVLIRATNMTGSSPTLLISAGLTGALEDAWTSVGQVAVAAGCDVVAFDSPAHAAMMRNKGPGPAAEWQTVVTAVTDQLSEMAEVVPGRLTVVSCGEDGQWVANAAVLYPLFSVPTKGLKRAGWQITSNRAVKANTPATDTFQFAPREPVGSTDQFSKKRQVQRRSHK